MDVPADHEPGSDALERLGHGRRSHVLVVRTWAAYAKYARIGKRRGSAVECLFGERHERLCLTLCGRKALATDVLEPVLRLVLEAK
jgi:hypothetical protein